MQPGPDELVQAVRAVDSATRRDEPIFVGLTENQYTFINPLIAYYLADRSPGTRWTAYNPGITNRDETQADMVGTLDDARVPILLLDDSFARVFEPQNESRNPGSMILDASIVDRYRLMCSFGDFRVMALTDPGISGPPCPDLAGRP